ncbi:MAG TPA: helix-turn-helix domain-containing protein [Candidatus Udaeobacter sp.]|nr:helix-turn-helix domain-containing protein [Candidatus Udaeobacter sp.]
MTNRVLTEPTVVLSAEDCARVDGFLARGLTAAKSRDTTVPASAVAIAADIHWAADQFRASALIKAGCATPGPDVGKELPAWASEERLTTAQAARIAGCSPTYLRRVIHRGELHGTRGRGGGYLVTPAALAAWVVGRQDRHKAA